uniref:Anticomplement protein IxAC-B5 n=1 Tax=Ixodes ricinus TaxID=34613 RepID=A9DFN5_IXORI|nr:anticomplement protein IxAC-B5 precursor [Ixodes ricinus]
MKTALTCALFGILFFGSLCSSNEETQEQEPTPTPQDELYKRNYQNASGLCGSWYRNESSLESIYNCTLKTLDEKNHTIVNKTWEGFRLSRNFTIPQLVGLMCNFSVAMPDNFTLMFKFDGSNELESPEGSYGDSVTTEAPQVPEKELFYAEGNCSVKIYASTTTPPPTTPSEPAVVAIA